MEAGIAMIRLRLRLGCMLAGKGITRVKLVLPTSDRSFDAEAGLYAGLQYHASSPPACSTMRLASAKRVPLALSRLYSKPSI